MIYNTPILVENIRTVISFPEAATPDQMRLYARDYAEACTELNRRMMQSIQHLRKGNLAESVRLAEMKPNLIELYASLDFAERGEWNEIVSTLGFAVPPPLPAEQQRELNNAYLKLSPQEPLLRLHRLHALNGSPVRERLSIIRAIAKADSQNLFWRSDQENFEKIRLKELGKEINNAAATNNITQIQSLYNELSSPDWVIPPPIKYRQTLCSKVLQNYAEILLKHFDTFNYDEALGIYTSMQNILAANAMTMPNAIQQKIRAAVQWVNETQRLNELQKIFDRTTIELQDALDAESPVPILERIHYALLNAATQASKIIPEPLEERYQTRIANDQLLQARKIKLIVAAVACIGIFLGGLLLWGLTLRNFDKSVSETLSSLKNIEDEQRYEDIPGTIQQIKSQLPKVAGNPQVASVIEKLCNKYNEDKERAENFAQYYAQASQLLDSISEPDKNNITQIKIAVDHAERLVRIAQEKFQFNELKRRYDSVALIVKEKIDTEYGKILDAIIDEFNELQRNANFPPNERISRLAKLSLQIKNLQQQHSDASPAWKKQGDSLLDSIIKHKTKIEFEIKQNETFKNLVHKIPQWNEYKIALREFSTTYPDHPSSSDAMKVMKELDDTQVVADLLINLTKTYADNSSDIKSLQTESAELLKMFAELSSKISVPPEQLFPPAVQLQMLSAMKPYTKDTFKSSNAFLQSLAKQEVWRWIKDDKWYYLIDKPEKAKAYKYITTFVSEEKTVTISDNEFKPEKIPNTTQFEFSNDALKKIDSINDNAVEVIGGLITQLIASDDIDPILKCILLDLFITDMSAIDPIFAANFQPCLDIINDGDVDRFTNWMDIDSKNTIPQRNSAITVLKCLPDVKQIIERTKKEHAQLKSPVTRSNLEFEWVGILIHEDNQWQCLLKSPSIIETGSFYIFRKETDKTMTPTKIGTATLSGILLTDNENSCLQCLPVFFKQEEITTQKTK